MPDFKRAMQDALQRESEKKAVRKPRLRPDELVEARRKELADSLSTVGQPCKDSPVTLQSLYHEESGEVQRSNSAVSEGTRSADSPQAVEKRSIEDQPMEGQPEPNKGPSMWPMSTDKIQIPITARVRGIQWQILEFIYREAVTHGEGKALLIRPGKLAVEIGASPKTVQTMLGRLKDRGYIMNYPKVKSPGPGGYGVYRIAPEVFAEIQALEAL